jgi:hypothetical protein
MAMLQAQAIIASINPAIFPHKYPVPVHQTIHKIPFKLVPARLNRIPMSIHHIIFPPTRIKCTIRLGILTLMAFSEFPIELPFINIPKPVCLFPKSMLAIINPETLVTRFIAIGKYPITIPLIVSPVAGIHLVFYTDVAT